MCSLLFVPPPLPAAWLLVNAARRRRSPGRWRVLPAVDDLPPAGDLPAIDDKPTAGDLLAAGELIPSLAISTGH